MTKRLTAVALVGLAGIAFVWALASLAFPFQSDHGVYAWMADTLLGGGMPYRDAWDVKGPAALFAPLLAQLAFGRTPLGIRAIDLVVLGAAGAALFRLLRAWCGPTTAAFGSLMWVLSYAALGFRGTAQPDGTWAMLLLLTLAPLLRGEPARRLQLVAAAACVGGLTLLKPHYLLFVAVPVLAAVTNPPGARRRGDLAWIAGALLLPVAAVLAWFRARGALDPFLDAFIGFNAAKNSSGLVAAAAASLFDGMFAQPVILVIVPFAAGGLAILAARDGRTAAMMAAWIAIAALVIHVQRPYFDYRLLVATPPLALLAAIALRRLAVTPSLAPPPWTGRLVAIMTAAALFVLVARTPAADAARWARALRSAPARQALLERARFLGTTAAGERRLATFVAQHARPGERVFVFRHPAVYFLADRPAASRLSILAAFGAGAPPRYVRAHLAELERDLERTSPALIALPDTLAQAPARLSELQPIRDLPGHGAALDPQYRLIRHADGFAVFARATSASPH